jgi:hypothetical protein
MKNLDPGDLMGASAAMATRGVLGPAVAKAASRALRDAQKITGSTFAQTTVLDFQSVRGNAELAAAVSVSLAKAHDQVVDLLKKALEAGYRATGERRAEDLGLSFTWGTEDQAIIDAFPIVDHSADEHADMLIAGLSFDVQGSVAMVISGALGADVLGDKLDQIAASFSQRVGSVVADAWHAGASAAVRSMALALA